jgi:hypothetical protein
LIEENMPWDCISCKYQRQARYQKERIRYLEKELKAAREEINLLKAGNSNSKTKDQGISDDLRNWTKAKKILSPGTAGFLLMMHLTYSQATDSVYWKLIRKAQVC